MNDGLSNVGKGKALQVQDACSECCVGGLAGEAVSSAELRALGEKLIVLADALASDPQRPKYASLHEPLRPPATLASVYREAPAAMLFHERRLADLATSIYQARRSRAKHLPADLFAEPAWDMLLDLFISAVERRRISVTSLCYASDVPPTTALRWLTALEKQSLVERVAHPQDRRVNEIVLTREGHRKVRAALEEWQKLL